MVRGIYAKHSEWNLWMNFETNSWNEGFWLENLQYFLEKKSLREGWEISGKKFGTKKMRIILTVTLSRIPERISAIIPRKITEILSFPERLMVGRTPTKIQCKPLDSGISLWKMEWHPCKNIGKRIPRDIPGKAAVKIYRRFTGNVTGNISE